MKELESLIHFWKDSLAEHRLLMSPSAVYLVEQTIKNLEKLAALTAGAVAYRIKVFLKIAWSKLKAQLTARRRLPGLESFTRFAPAGRHRTDASG